MYFKKLILGNFKCFKDFEISFNKNLTVLVGNNGSGKTSVLEGVAIALSTMFNPLQGLKSIGINKTQARLKSYKIGSTNDSRPQYPVVVSAEAEINGRDLLWSRTLNTEKGQTTIKEAKELADFSKELQKFLQKGDSSLMLPVIAYYGTGRLWDYHREKSKDVFKKTTRTNGYINSLDGTANIKLMMNWFRKMTIQKYRNQENGLKGVLELETVFSAMEKCYEYASGAKNVKIQYNFDTNELDVIYLKKNGKQMRIPLNQLSDGYKSTVSLVADIAYRMAVLNPQCLGDVCAKTDGIVLIDEIDLHLHPLWQQRILKDLASIFPKVQFIVTTHAPEVINSVPKENVVVLENLQAFNASVETYGKDANGILRSIMRVQERPAEIMGKFEEFYAAIDDSEYKKANEILNKLAKKIGDDPELAAMRTQLEMEQIEVL